MTVRACGRRPARPRRQVAVDGRALWEFHLPALEACAAAGSRQVMCSYNAINGVPACAEPRLTAALRRAGGSRFFVVSDYDAWQDLADNYGRDVGCAAGDYACAAAVAVRAGGAMEGGGQIVARELAAAQRAGLVSAAAVRAEAERIMRARIEMGTLDAIRPGRLAYNALTVARDVLSAAHERLNLEAAREGVVLLKNDADALPLPAARMRRVLVVGHAAASASIPLGPYEDGPAANATFLEERVTTLLQGITGAVGGNGTVVSEPGCASTLCEGEDRAGFDAAAAEAARASAVVLVLNLVRQARSGDRGPARASRRVA